MCRSLPVCRVLCFCGCHVRILTVSVVAVPIFLLSLCLSVSSSFYLSSSFCSTRSRGLTFTSARVFVSGVDSPGLHTDTENCTLRAVHFSFVPTVYRQGTGSPEARTSRTSKWPTAEPLALESRGPKGNRRSRRQCDPDPTVKRKNDRTQKKAKCFCVGRRFTEVCCCDVL